MIRIRQNKFLIFGCRNFWILRIYKNISSFCIIWLNAWYLYCYQILVTLWILWYNNKTLFHNEIIIKLFFIANLRPRVETRLLLSAALSCICVQGKGARLSNLFFEFKCPKIDMKAWFDGSASFESRPLLRFTRPLCMYVEWDLFEPIAVLLRNCQRLEVMS